MSNPVVAKKEVPSLLAGVLGSIHEELDQVEVLLQDASWGPVPRMPQVADHLLGAGGKRLRPLLCLLAARHGNVPLAPALKIAVVSELMHTASLLHDDVVDESPLRRGKPSAPRVFGNSACVLMGDALMARSISILSELDQRTPLISLARCVRKMAIGEILQLAQAGQPGTKLLSYLRIIEGKTSGLFAWCSTAGELCPEPLRSTLRRFGRRLGMAFQITDDILDYTGDPEHTGKAVGTDLREGKMTLPLFYACQLQPTLRQKIHELAQSSISIESVSQIVAEVRRSGGVEAAQHAASTLLARAHHTLGQTPTTIWQEHLHTLADFVVHRTS